MTFNVEDLIGQVKPPVRSATICIDQSLQAEHDELVEEMERERRSESPTMGGGAKAREIAARIGEVEQEMQSKLQTFHFKGLNKATLHKLYERFPAKESNLIWDMQTGGYALVAASAVEPAMTEAQAERLFDVLSDGQASLLIGAAWLASTGSSAVPLSARASELRRGNV